jgi:excisionase family DNA binding protein
VYDNNAPDAMITVHEAARRLNRSTEQVRRYLREGKLRGRRIGGQWFIDEQDIDAPQLPVTSGRGQMGEAIAMYGPGTSDREAYKANIEEVIARVAARREQIRKRIGDVKIDVVEMLREDRESH